MDDIFTLVEKKPFDSGTPNATPILTFLGAHRASYLRCKLARGNEH